MNQPSFARGQGDGEIVLLGAMRKAAPVQGDAQFGQFEAFRARGGKLPREIGQSEALGDDGIGVVIALEQEDRHACLGEPRDLAIEEQSDGGVAPVAVENVAGKNREGDFFLQHAVDQVGKGVAAGGGEPRGERFVAQAQALERAAQMEIGGMEEGEAHGVPAAIRVVQSRPRRRG